MERPHQRITAALDMSDGIPDRIELMPIGAFRTADHRREFRLDDPQAVIERSMAASAGNVLPIDFDHGFGGQGTRAAGWITRLYVEGERMMAEVEWTREGRQRLEERAYRFVSPDFYTDHEGIILQINGGGLVNNPALPQLRQLASRKENRMDPIEAIATRLGVDPADADAITARIDALTGAERQLASIRTGAGLEEGVEGEEMVRQVCARISAAEAAADPDPARYVPMDTFTELQRQFAALSKDYNGGRVDAAIQEARDAGKLTAGLEPWARQYASKDLDAFRGWVEAAPVLVREGRELLPAPPQTSDGLSAVERQICAALGQTHEKFLATRQASQEAKQ